MRNPFLTLRWRFPAVMIGLAGSLTVPTSAATISWINPDGGLWSAATNWSTGTVPTATDDVLITMDGTYSVSLDVNATIANLTLGGAAGAQTLMNAARTLWLANPSTVAARGVLALSGGVIDGGGTLTLHGTLTWSSGWVGGAALMTIAPDGVLSLEGGDNKGLAGTINNDGRVVWSGGGQIWQNTGQINNRPGGVFEVQTDSAMLLVGGAPTNQNAGLILKSGGTGTTMLGVALANTGTAEVQTGVISYAAGSVFSAGSSFAGAGTNLVAGGVITLEGAIHSENLQIGGATVAGTSTISGTLTWTREWIGAAAVMTIATNGTLRLVGPADKGLAGTLNNLGHVVWSDSGQIAMGGGTFNNLADGIFEIQNDQAVYYHSGTPLLSNAGWVRKSAGTGVTTLGVPFSNSGTVEVQTGIVGLTAASTLGPGSTFLGAGTNLLANGVITLDGAIHSENLQLGGATAVGTNTISGTLT